MFTNIILIGSYFNAICTVHVHLFSCGKLENIYVSVQLVNDRPKDVAVPENDLGDADDKDAEAGAKDDALQAGVPQELPAVSTEYNHRLAGACSLLFSA